MHIIIRTIAAALACSTAFADEVKKEAVKSETKNGNASANAVAKATSTTTTTTNINGRPVTIVEDQDENGNKRLRMITYENGKPKVKDITPKVKAAVKEKEPMAKKKLADDAKKPAGEIK